MQIHGTISTKVNDPIKQATRNVALLCDVFTVEVFKTLRENFSPNELIGYFSKKLSGEQASIVRRKIEKLLGATSDEQLTKLYNQIEQVKAAWAE